MSPTLLRPAFSLTRHLAALLLFAGLAQAAQAVPAAPTSLRCVVTTAGAITLLWDDNATDETHFQISYTANAVAQAPLTVPTANSAGTGQVGVSFNVGSATYTFTVRAYTGTTAVISGPSNTITLVTTAAFAAPTSPTASTLPNGTVQVTWVDNSYTEAGYFVEYALAAAGPFSVVAATGPSPTSLPLTGLAPGTAYYFKVRGFQGTAASPTALTAYATPVVSATTPGTLATPTSLTVTPTSETAATISYADNTANNTGYELWIRLTGGGAFSYLGDVGDVTSINTGGLLAPGTGYDFQVRAYYQNGANPRSYSNFSNTASVTTPFNAPTGLTATPSAASPYLISFGWGDNSIAEDSYELEYREQGAPFYASRKVVGANVTSIANLPEFKPGTVYEFRVRARAGGTGSNYATATAVTRNGFSSKPYAPIQTGTFFSYQMATLSQSARTSWSVAGLPPGLVFDSGSGVISGTPTTAGLYAVAMTANFTSGPAHTLSLALRIQRPPAAPQISAAIGAQTLTQGGTAAIALAAKFADPDTESAMRLVTSKGPVDLVFFNGLTPQTVANFGSYNYADVLFHRAPAGFVVQGGGYKSYAAPDVFERLATAPPVPNEPGISNTYGTVAMAKVGDDPDSATSEFFFNLGDNSANLDNQNGGFTVFARVAAPSLGTTLAALAAAPTGNYPVGLHTPTQTVGTTFTDLPFDQAPLPAAVDQSRLLKVTSVTALPVLTYAVTGNTNPSVASASVASGSLQLTALAPGVASITVSAADVDGNVTPQTFTLTVQQTFAQWAAAQGTTAGALDNPDRDALTNLQEWAFFGNPGLADTATHLPLLALTPVAGATFAELTFPVRKFAANLSYAVEASGTLLTNDWTTIWTSAQGFGVPAVTAAADQPDRTIVTVRDSASSPTAPRRFLRTKVQ